MHKSILNNIFETTMKREHHTATTFTTGEKFECFFRRSNDNLNKHDTMVMYYRVNAPIQAGTLISYGGYTFLALNKETTENTVYYKSALIRTNGTINTHNLSVVGLPLYSDSINNATSTNGMNLSIIDGNAEVLTEDNASSRNLSVNDLFNEWGRTWKISNLFYVDGFCHIILEVNANVTPTYEYKAVLSPLASVHVMQGDTDSIKAIAYINDNEISNSIIEYSSSNEEIAKIDVDGNIEYVGDGEVSFTATWIEQSVSATTDIVSVQSKPESDDVTIYMEKLEEVYDGFESDFSCYALKGGVRDDGIPVAIKAENVRDVSNQTAYLKYIKISNLGNGKFEVLADNLNMLGKTFDLVAYNEEYSVENRQNIKVVSLF